MADELKNLNLSFTRRNLARRGVFSSDDWNNSFSELASDAATITTEWNTKLIPLFSTIPGGDEDSDINAFVGGLDGRTIWVDSSVSSTDDDLTYYDASSARPVTIKEAFDNIYESITSQILVLKEEVITETADLTPAQKIAIGSNIFDAAATSSPTSLDGKSENNRLNIIQLATDIYGAGYTLDNDGAGNLVNSIQSMVNALLLIHNGSWSSDITVDHTGVSITVTQSDINATGPGSDVFAGPPTDLEEDLNQIRTRIKAICGTAGWLSAFSSLYAGGADSLEDLLASTAGTGTKSATNPWGYNWNNIDGLETRINAINTFCGQSSPTDNIPVYSSLNYIVDGDPLEKAIGTLDQHLGTLSGYLVPAAIVSRAFIGQSNEFDATPTYGAGIIVSPADPLDVAIGKLDQAVGSGLSVIQVDPNVGSAHTSAFTASYNTLHRVVPASGINVTLPTVSGQQGGSIKFKVQAANVNPITLIPYDVDTIDGAANLTIASGYAGLEIVSDGITDWMTMSRT